MAAIKLLLADDEAALRFLLTETLADEGYEITEAEDGGEAMQALRDQVYTLAILDYMMPEKTGVEVCAWLRSSDSPNRDIPVLLLTAKALEKDKELARTAGVTQYILKPFSPLQLMDIVAKYVQAP